MIRTSVCSDPDVGRASRASDGLVDSHSQRRASLVLPAGQARSRRALRDRSGIPALQTRKRLTSMPPRDPDVADLAPSDPVLTAYDEHHAVTYMPMLDADAEGAGRREVARIVLHIDPDPCGPTFVT